MDIWSLFKQPIIDAGSGIIGSIGTAIDKIVTNKGEKLELQNIANKQLQDYTNKLTELTNSLEVEYLKDIQSARAMQQAALQQDDLFSKRFIYYLAISLITAAIAFDFTLFFANIPTDNRDMINMALGTLNSLGFASVVTFFLGSSRSSAQKTDIITSLTNNSKG